MVFVMMVNEFRNFEAQKMTKMSLKNFSDFILLNERVIIVVQIIGN